MTTLWSRVRPLALSLAIPVGGIAISYALLVDNPLRAKLGEAQAKIAKLSETVKQRQPEQVANLRSLEQIQQSRREFDKLVTTIPPAPVENRPSPTESNASPLAQLANTIALLGRHHLTCLASTAVEESSAAIKPTQNALPPSTQARASDDGELRLTLVGSFDNMHRAMAELHAAVDCGSVVTVEMQASPSDLSIHQWTIVLRMEGH